MSGRAPYSVHWFRRDLRVAGNEALASAHERFDGRVLGVFFLDPEILGRPDFSANRFEFYLRTLEALREEMGKRGGDLLVVDRPPREGFRDLVTSLRRSALGAPASVSWNRDYEPFARERDASITELLETMGIETASGRDHLLIEPTELLRTSSKSGENAHYQVFGAFRRKWLEHLASPEGRARVAGARAGLESRPPRFKLRWPEKASSFPFDGEAAFRGIRKRAERAFSALDMLPGPAAGSAAARDALDSFARDRLRSYGEARDFPAEPGTSRLSPYLKNGSLTVPQIVARLGLDEKGASAKFLDELIWREFYVHLLYHRPDVEHRSFLAKYRRLEWENDPGKIERWEAGRTGYPIVDAAMRQLNRTGWMHNRARMIVASFLVKDLLVDWRVGERYFMRKLLDGDLASNNGGWQWAASTGCDPQPYFRIFNPVSQGLRFDPEARYVLEWVPELRKRAAGGEGPPSLHQPAEPVVVHSERRKRALELFRQASGR